MTKDTGRQWLEAFWQEQKFCGCGRPEDLLDYVGKILAMMDDKFAHARTDQYDAKCEELERFIGVERGHPLYWLLLYWLDAVGLTEHGGAVSGSWTTEKGGQFQEAVAAIGDGEMFPG